VQLIVRNLGSQSYETTWHAMQVFTNERTETTDDEIWLVQHSPIYTLGKSGKREHLLDAGSIPVIQADRGGQVTYHGPGQLVVYVLLDISRLGLGVRELVTRLEASVISLLFDNDIRAASRADAPGVYVDGKKIAALGLRIRRGRCFHGLALNVEMDLEPFDRINPCGYPGLEVTQMADLIDDIDFENITQKLLFHLRQQLKYD
jgi:lipoyl(octanoyl) transferase